MKQFYGVMEVARASGYSAGTIQNRISRGEIFAVQGTKRGAYRIPSSSYLAYMSSLGIVPKPEIELLPPSEFESLTAGQIYEREVSPALQRSGYADVPALLRASEQDPTLYLQYRDVIHVYTAFLARKAAELPALVPA